MNSKLSPTEFVVAGLGPGEELLWSQPLSRRAARKWNPTILFAQVVASIFFGLTLLAGVGIVAFFQPIEPTVFILLFPPTLMGLGSWIYARLATRHLRCTGLFAATNHRLLVVYGGGLRSYPYAELSSISVRRRANGTADLLFGESRSTASLQTGGVNVALPMQTRIGFFDVADIDALERIVSRSQSLAQEAPTTAELVTQESPAATPDVPLCPPGELRFGRQGPQKFEGGFLVFWGLFAIAISVAMLSEKLQWELFIGVAIGVLAMVVGLRMLLWRDVLILNPATQTFIRRRGWAPRLRDVEGSFEDLDRLRLDFECNQSNDELPSAFKVKRWSIVLHWKGTDGKGTEFSLVETSDRVQVVVEGKRLAAALRLPFDQTAAKWEDRQGRQDARDEERTRRWRPFVRAAWIVAALAVVNALLPGIYWRDRWQDENANRFVRCSNGYRTLTRITSPTGTSLGSRDHRWFLIGQSTASGGWFAQKGTMSNERRSYHGSIRLGSFAETSALDDWE